MVKEERLKGMVYGSFIGDALALGVHWIYSPAYIRKKVGVIEGMIDPITSYHPTKKAGDLTHYGDLGLFLMRYVRGESDFHQEGLTEAWASFIEKYDGYMDHASKRARQNYAKGVIPAGRKSIPDFAASSRIAGLIYNYSGDEEMLLEKAREQTLLTHNMDFSLAATDFVVRSVLSVLHGSTPLEGIVSAAEANTHEGVDELIGFGLDFESEDLDYAIGELGPNCYVDGALQTCIFLIKNYGEDINRCLTINAALGGDSAGRGLYLGMILGAYHGYDAINREWIEALRCRGEIEELMG